MSTRREARTAGQQAVAAVRRQFARQVASLLKSSPERLATAVETGLVSRAWLDEPGDEKLLAAAPSEVIERFLEREAEQRPSALSHLGLSAIQILASRRGQSDGSGRTERRAVAFTDLVGFTAYTNEHGDATASATLADHYRSSGPIVRSRGGRVVKRLGDGLLLSFPEPEAAVLACIELTESVPPPLALRAGVHVGEVVTMGDDLVGHVVNVAARVTEEAGAGEVFVTAEVCDAVGDIRGVQLGRLVRRRLKGVTERVGVCSARRAE